jgi:hypothetical protein
MLFFCLFRVAVFESSFQDMDALPSIPRYGYFDLCTNQNKVLVLVYCGIDNVSRCDATLTHRFYGLAIKMHVLSIICIYASKPVVY